MYDFTWGSVVCFLLKALDSLDEETNKAGKQLRFDAAFCLIFPSIPLCSPHSVVHEPNVVSEIDSVLVLVGFSGARSSPSALTLLLPTDDTFPVKLHGSTVLALLEHPCKTLLTPATEQASSVAPVTPGFVRFVSEVGKGLSPGALVVLLLREYFFLQWLEE